ncbi:MAG TPA: hypothetical protein VMN76_09330, partial [Acidobacteriota bacterium]|nr:hypothetical protein [Acidobacteriota bacterium]
CKQPPSDSIRSEIEGLVKSSQPDSEAALWAEDERFFQAVAQWLDRERKRQVAIHDLNFLLNAREELVGILENEIERLNRLPLWKFAARRLRRWFKHAP